jgi:hypothetical protein
LTPHGVADDALINEGTGHFKELPISVVKFLFFLHFYSVRCPSVPHARTVRHHPVEYSQGWFKHSLLIYLKSAIIFSRRYNEDSYICNPALPASGHCHDRLALGN